MTRWQALVGVVALICALVAPAAMAAVPEGLEVAPRASVEKQLKKLKKQVRRLQRRVDALTLQTGPQGPQGPQGPAGTAPPCLGNDAGDFMVAAGSICIDRYEASVWSSPTGGTQLVSEAQIDAACPNDGQPTPGAPCTAFFARSVPGVEPAHDITYFQAQQALANSGRRLPTNAEWQQAVSGTPDSNACNVGPGSVQNTGANPACVSRFGANDMVGNLSEWVGEWVPASTDCPGWGSFSDDAMCLSGASTTLEGPGTLIRGGRFGFATTAGPLAVDAQVRPIEAGSGAGFRGVR